MFTPNLFSTPMLLFVKPEYTTKYGVRTKVFTEGTLIFGSFKTFGGTEWNVNGGYSIEDTASVETWFRPDIQSGCEIEVNGARYEIFGEPENIEMRNQFCKFKVRRVKGGA
jgi:SPP1 family predicted phage head-tail adaptor